MAALQRHLIPAQRDVLSLLCLLEIGTLILILFKTELNYCYLLPLMLSEELHSTKPNEILTFGDKP